MNDRIDIVVTWVDGNDPVWRMEKETWMKKVSAEKSAVSHIRFESWDNLQYWFRDRKSVV